MLKNIKTKIDFYVSVSAEYFDSRNRKLLHCLRDS